VGVTIDPGQNQIKTSEHRIVDYGSIRGIKFWLQLEEGCEKKSIQQGFKIHDGQGLSMLQDIGSICRKY